MIDRKPLPIKLTLPAIAGAGARVEVAGTDFSPYCRSLSVTASVGEITTLTLELIAFDGIEIEGLARLLAELPIDGSSPE